MFFQLIKQFINIIVKNIMSHICTNQSQQKRSHKATPQTSSNDTSMSVMQFYSNPNISLSLLNDGSKFPKLFNQQKQNINFSFNPMSKLNRYNNNKKQLCTPKSMHNSVSQRIFSQSKLLNKSPSYKHLNQFKPIKSIRDGKDVKTITRPSKTTSEYTAKSKNQVEQSIKVYVRIKPLQHIEDNQSIFHINEKTLKIQDKILAFDEVFPSCSNQQQIFNKVSIPVLNSLFEGYNGTIFAYGQTGSGKTYTIFGNCQDQQNRGLIARTIRHIYEKSSKQNIKIQLSCTMLQLYKQTLIDMFNIENTELKIKQNKNGIFIENLTETKIISQQSFIQQIDEAQKFRRVATTKINQKSSRSHTILTIIIKFQHFQSKLCLIDLAGSQKVRKSGASGQTLQQTKKINYSLSCLGNVINALTSKNKQHIPFRDSKLTRILKDSLTGKFKTSIIVNCSAQQLTTEQTLSSLKFAQRAKKIKISPKVCEKNSNSQSIQYLHFVIKKLTNDLNTTKQQLHRYKAICQSIDHSQQISIQQSRANEIGQPSIQPTARQIPSQRAYVSEKIQNYSRDMFKPKKIQISLSSLNISKTVANHVSGVQTPSVSSLSYRNNDYSNEDISLSFSMYRQQQTLRQNFKKNQM